MPFRMWKEENQAEAKGGPDLPQESATAAILAARHSLAPSAREAGEAQSRAVYAGTDGEASKPRRGFLANGGPGCEGSRGSLDGGGPSECACTTPAASRAVCAASGTCRACFTTPSLGSAPRQIHAEAAQSRKSERWFSPPP